MYRFCSAYVGACDLLVLLEHVSLSCHLDNFNSVAASKFLILFDVNLTSHLYHIVTIYMLCGEVMLP